MELLQGTNREAQLMGLTALVAQGLADVGPEVGGSTVRTNLTYTNL